MEDNNIELKIELEIKEAVKKVNELEADIKKISEDLNNAKTDILENGLKKVNSEANNLIGTLTKIGAVVGAGALLKSSAETIANFQQSITRLGAVAQASTTQLDDLKQKAMQLGGSTEYSSSQVADAMNYLAMAGFKTKQIMASVNDVLNLATIGQMDLARASDISSNILSGFGMKADEMGRVVDVMSATITNANTDISQLGEAMKYVAPNAKALGVSLEETATAIGVLSNAGMQGSMAGTNLAMVLSRLSAPTGKAKDDLEALGVKVFDTSGKFVGLKQVLEQLNKTMSGMSDENKMKYLKEIFGQEALKSVLVLMGEVDKSYTQLQDKISNSNGKSAEMKQKMRDTLMGAWKTLQSSLEKLVLTIGDDLLPAMTSFLKFITEGVQDITSFYEAHRELVGIVAKLATTFILLNKAMKISQMLFSISLITRIAGMGEAIAGAAKGAGLLATMLGKLGRANIIFLTLATAVTAVNSALGAMEDEVKEANDATSRLNDVAKESGDIFDEFQKHLVMKDGRAEIVATADELESMKSKAQKSVKAIEAQIKSLETKAKAGNNIWDSILGIDKAKQYETQIKVLKDRLEVLHKTIDKLKNTKPIDSDSVKKSAKQIEIINKTLLQSIKKDIAKRVNTHEKSLRTLESKEKQLADKVLQIQTRLKERLKQLENQRVLAVESIEKRIHDLQMGGASEYAKYTDLKIQADRKYAQAKKALEQGNMQLAKTYMSQYSNLISQLSNKEIKENGKVVISKKAANNLAIANLKKLEAMTNQYYKKEEQNAKSVANTKLKIAKAQLQAVREEIKLSVERLKIEKQLVEATTGKKIDIDVSGALKRIKEIDKQIKGLDKQIGKKRDIKVEADTSKAKQEVEHFFNPYKHKKIETELEAKTDKAKKKIDEVLEEVDTKKKGKPKTIEVGADTKEAKTNIDELGKDIENTSNEIKVDADTIEATEKIDELKQPTESEHSVKLPNYTSVVGDIKSLNNMNTHSTHTIYIRKVETHSTGGLVGEPLKLATGGSVFNRVQGRIAGYDPTDSDDVPAMLTRGEFVINREAVSHYGDGVMHLINKKMLQLPKFATGGLVDIPKMSLPNIQNGRSGYNTNKATDTVNVNLKLGKKSYKLMSDRDVAEALTRELKSMI